MAGTGLNLAALIPGSGDAAKVAAVVGKFVVKHPELLKPAMVLLVGVAPHVDEAAEWANIFRKIHGDDALNKFLKGGITEADLKVIADSRGNLLETLEVTKRADGKVVWLEEGTLKSAAGEILGTVYDKGGSGWSHIQNNHIYYHGKNQFKDEFGSAYDSENAIKELIQDGAKYGQKINDDGVYHYVEPNSGKKLLLIIGSNGHIVTAYPLKVK